MGQYCRAGSAALVAGLPMIATTWVRGYLDWLWDSSLPVLVVGQLASCFGYGTAHFRFWLWDSSLPVLVAGLSPAMVSGPCLGSRL